jgi:outer membrane protein assembly factor BamA
MITIILKLTTKITFILMMLLMWAQTTSASITNAYLGEIVVHVEGAKRTKDRTVESLVEKCLEKEYYKSWESIDSNVLRQCLSNSRLFESVEVRVNKPDIDVTIEDRWTLIPAPFAYSIDQKRSIGAAVIDSNFLGYGKTAGIVGAVSTDGNTYSLFYVDPSINFSNFTIRTSFNQSSNDLYLYQENTIINAYLKKELLVSVSPGYRITPTLGLSILLNYIDRRYVEVSPYTAVPDNYSSYSMGARLSYSNADYKLYYNEGVSAQLAWFQQIHRSDESANVAQTTLGFEWDKLLFKEHALQLALNAASLTDNGNASDVLTFGNARGFRGIEPNGLWTRNMTAVSADYQIPVNKVTDGIFTVAPFVDYGIYKPVSPASGNNYTAYGVGGYLFVNAISLPGVVGLLIGRNEEFMGNFIGFQFGYGY